MTLIRAALGLVLGMAIFAALIYYLVVGNISQRLQDAEVYAVAISDTDAYNRVYDEVLVDEALNDELAALLGNVEFQGHDSAHRVGVLRDVMPPSYLQEQTEANLVRFTGFLRNEREYLEIHVDLSEPLRRIEPAVWAEIDRVLDQAEVEDVSHLTCSDADRDRLLTEYALTLNRLTRGEIPEAVSPLPGLAYVCRWGGPNLWLAGLLEASPINSRAAEILVVSWNQLVDRMEEIHGPQAQGTPSTTGSIANDPQSVRDFVEQVSKDSLKLLVRPLVQPQIDNAIAEIKLELQHGNQLDLLRLATDNTDDLVREDIDEAAEGVREFVRAASGPGRVVALVVAVVGCLLLAAVHFPRPVTMLLWPGVTLFLGGGVCLAIGAVINSAIPRELKEAVVHSADYSPEVPTAAISLAGDLLESITRQATTGFMPAAITVIVVGGALIAASFFADALWAVLRRVLPGSGSGGR